MKTNSSLDALVSRGGEIGALIGATDWSKTPLGPLESWPRSLLNYVAMILELPSPAIIFWGPGQTQIYNEGYTSIMGPRHPRYFGAPASECWPDTYPIIYPWMAKVLERGERVTVEKTQITVTRYGFSEEAWFTFTLSPLRNDAGEIAGILQPVVEVTGSVLSERRADTLRALVPVPGSVDAAADAVNSMSANRNDIPFSLVYLWDESRKTLEPAAQTRNLDACETAPARLLPAARRAFEFHGPVEVDNVEELLGDMDIGPWPEPPRSAVVLPLGQPHSGYSRGAVVFGLSPRLHFDDRYRSFLELSAGQIARATAQAQNARERAELLEREQAARKEAELQKQHLVSLFTQAPTPIVVLRGPDHVIEFVNQHTCRIWGREQEKIIDRPLFEVLPELRGQVFEDLLNNVLETGETHIGRETLAKFDSHGDGTLEDVYLNFVYAPLRNVGGEVDGILVIAFNVTEEVRAREEMDRLRAEAEIASRAKDEFLAMLGHELRNPLAPILTALQLLALKADDVGARERSIIERQVRHLIALVDDLLDVSRISRGKIELDNELVELAEVTATAIETSSPLLEERQHALVVDVPKDGLAVCGDRRRLAQIISNLLSNAAKFTPSQGRITIAGRRDGDAVVLTVEDNGVGIGADILPHVFDRFSQGQQPIERSHGGLGLGLSIVKSLVGAHGGSVEARSPGKGGGTSMIVRLPRAQGDFATAAEQTRAPGHPAADKRLRVLIVDDNADAAQLLVDALTTFGYEARPAHDGPSALRVAGDFHPEVAVVDLGLPVMDGFELARRFNIDPVFRRTRLIALTGYGQEADRARSAAAGFERHLVKPVTVESLRSAIDGVAGYAPKSAADATVSYPDVSE
ncbi:MAG TPA: ATP-binding protein [Woeseiaceae bacterium]|nr:ATP-binding protein [Woeseiaceae bacterium]